VLLSVLAASTAVALKPTTAQPSLRRANRALALRGGSISLDLASIGASYAASLAARPVLTKSLTSAAIFGFSDVAAQRIAPPADGMDTKRTITTTLVGLCYFGPALHYWLQMVTRIVPGFDVKSTLLKTLMGQLVFGPAITCIFFGASLVSMSGLASGLSKWPQKIRQDLLVTWGGGLTYWPFVDLICYGLVPVTWIPLGYNVASFFWTIFLSMQAARQVKAD